MAGLGTMITLASSEWVLLNAVYHHVLAQRASPEAAQIEIATAHQNGQLRWRCTFREYKALPKLRLSRGEHPPQLAPTVTAHYPIPPDTRFDTFDWERSRAFSPNDPVTTSVYEYLDITAHRDDVLALWPVGAPSAASDKPQSDESKLDAAMPGLDELAAEGQFAPQKELLKEVSKRLVSIATENNWKDETATSRQDPDRSYPTEKQREDDRSREAAETEAETLRRTIALAIIDGQPKGRSTKTADLKRSVADNWNAECARFRVDPKKVLAPSRDTINRYLGRRKN